MQLTKWNNAGTPSSRAIEIFGGSLIGLWLAVILFGVTTIQTVLYFRRFRDNRTTRYLVIATNLIQLGIIIEMAQATYKGAILDRGNVTSLLNLLSKRASALFIAAILTSGLVQMFFLHRIWILSRSLWKTMLVLLPIISQIIFGISLVLEWLLGTDFNVNEGRLNVVFTAWIASEIVTDFGIATMMVYLLHQRKSEMDETNTLLNKLVLYSISTGAITVVISIAMVIALRSGHTPLLTIFSAMYGGTFLLAMLSNLHSRSRLVTGTAWEPHFAPGARILGSFDTRRTTISTSVTGTGSANNTMVPPSPIDVSPHRSSRDVIDIAPETRQVRFSFPASRTNAAAGCSSWAESGPASGSGSQERSRKHTM